MGSCRSDVQWQLRGHSWSDGYSHNNSHNSQFGIAQSYSKGHFTPGNAFYALCAQKVQSGMARSGQGCAVGQLPVCTGFVVLGAGESSFSRRRMRAWIFPPKGV